jgi:hypothetical protein
MKNMMVLLVMFILGGQVMGQVIPDEYKNLPTIDLSNTWNKNCGYNLVAKPYQKFVMNQDETKLYNQIVSKKYYTVDGSKKYYLFIQGVVTMGNVKYVVWTDTWNDESWFLTYSDFVKQQFKSEK